MWIGNIIVSSLLKSRTILPTKRAKVNKVHTNQMLAGVVAAFTYRDHDSGSVLQDQRKLPMYKQSCAEMVYQRQ